MQTMPHPREFSHDQSSPRPHPAHDRGASDDPSGADGPPAESGPRSSGHADPVPVAAAVIRRADRFLLGLRPAHKRHGGLWEFPGGKLQEQETIAAAVRRELAEELGVRVRHVGRVLFEARDPGSPFLVRFVEVELDPNRTPSPVEHEALAWLTVAELADHPLAPSDARFVAEHLKNVRESE